MEILLWYQVTKKDRPLVQQHFSLVVERKGTWDILFYINNPDNGYSLYFFEIQIRI